MVLVTRPEERIAPLLEGLVRLELHGLSSEEQVRLVETRLGVFDGVRAVCSELLPRVAGNPFFLLEMVDALLEKGSLEIRETPGKDGGDPTHALVRTRERRRGFSRSLRRSSSSSATACVSCRSPSTRSSTGWRSPAARS